MMSLRDTQTVMNLVKVVLVSRLYKYIQDIYEFFEIYICQHAVTFEWPLTEKHSFCPYNGVSISRG